MAKKYYDENGNPVEVKEKKRGGCLKWVLLIIGVLVLFGACAAIFSDGDDSTTDTETVEPTTEEVEKETAEVTEQGEPQENEEAKEEEEPQEIEESEEEEEEETQEQAEETPEEEPEEETAKEDDVPREYRNALRSAQSYVDMTGFSEAGLYEQLTSEYGEGYPDEAAQYAIENVVVDYNEEALESAQDYLEMTAMSDQRLFEQLTSEYGEQFTEEQAQYAIDNLD